TSEDDGSDILSDLAAVEVAEEEDTSSDDALSSLAAVEIDETPEDDGADILSELAATEVVEEEDTGSDDALSSLAAVEIEETPEDDGSDILSDLAAIEVDEEDDSSSDDALSSLAAVEIDDAPEDDGADILSELAATEVAEEEDTSSDGALSSLAAVEIDETPEDDGSDILSELAATEVVEEEDTSSDDALSSLAAVEIEEAPEDDGADVLSELAALETDASDDAEQDDDIDDLASLLGDLDEDPEEAEEDTLADVLGSLAEPDEGEAQEDSIDDILGGLDDLDDTASEEDEEADSLDDLLGDLVADDDDDQPDSDAGTDDLDDLLGDLTGDDGGDDLDDLFADLEDDAAEDTAETNELDDLLGDLTGDDDSGLDDLLGDDTDDDASGDTSDLDDLLGSLDDDAGEDSEPVGDDLDDLLGALGDEDDSDSASGDADSAAATEDAGAVKPSQNDEPEFAYGTISADRPDPQKLERKRFRLAILGDFSGRAAKGIVETGDDLAARRAVILDPDTVEDVIESFATELMLPIGKDGAGMTVKLGELDDLHPDELYENVELFSELVGLRKQLQSGVTADHAAKTLRAWGEKHGTRVKPPKPRSGGNAVPADCRLSAFQQLIGDTDNQLAQASPVQDLLARVVGPHIRALPNPDIATMTEAVDEALSDAMRMVLHHPEFQSLESQWRSLDLIARSVEDDDTLDVMLYDISAEELAVDLAATEDLSECGFVRLLTGEPLDEENGRGGYSALIGLYQFEETPPHAELLGRIARVAAHVDAPFFASISPAFLETEKDKLPPVVTKAWDTLRGMTEAGHLGLVSPRFMLRRPYGAKSEPIYEFQFEEFTESEGLRGMLWANPVVLVAILLARSFKQNGASMGLGQIMSLGDIPFHYVNDRFGDQVALPCTERNINLDKIALAQERGFMAVSAVKGRDEIRLTSFLSLAGKEILGPWSGVPAPEPSPPDPKSAAPTTDAAVDELDDLGLDDLDLGSDGDDLGLDDLDDLLAGFGDDNDGGDDDDALDAELAALLDDL
ncbi:type VI secretion system contractile sheath small subunit, partial [Sedimentitalea sp. CY04]